MEKDYLFLLEENEVGYAYYFEREEIRDVEDKKIQVYLYQTRFPIDEFAKEDIRNTLLEEARLQIADVETIEEAHAEILSYWFLPPSTPVLDVNVLLEDALKKLSEEIPILSL